MKNFIIVGLIICSMAGCATTDIQPLSKNTFKVVTTAAPACGPRGARLVANQAAAIEVIKRGGDKFVFLIGQDQIGSHITGVSYNRGYSSVYSANDQSMVVRMVTKSDPEYNNALSAREQLGANWQEKVLKGIPNTCTGN